MEKQFDFFEIFENITSSLFLGRISLEEGVFELFLSLFLIFYLLFVFAIWRQVRLMSTTLETKLAPEISRIALFYIGLILLTLATSFLFFK